MTFPIIDLHCDVLYQMDSKNFDFLDDARLDANLAYLRAGNTKVQTFAIFVSPSLDEKERLRSAMRQYYFFKHYVATPVNRVVHIKEWSQIEALAPDEIGAILTIEGVDFFEGDIKFWHLFQQFGVLNIGLTWNISNEAADSIAQPLGRGVTDFGKEIIALNNEHFIFTDVSHLSEESFWDILELAKYPIATHSNARALCGHVRNLTDAQITAMIKRDAPIHVVYNPPFITEQGENVTIADLIKHIDYICALGGKGVIGLGSDFDGIDTKIQNLETAAQQVNLINELLKFYSEDDVKGFAYQNFMRHLPK